MMRQKTASNVTGKTSFGEKEVGSRFPDCNSRGTGRARNFVSASIASHPPKFEVDPSWPKSLPNLWVTVGIGGVCVDAQDHVFILNRRDLTDNELDVGRQTYRLPVSLGSINS